MRFQQRFLFVLVLCLMSTSNAWSFSLTDKELPYVAPDVSFVGSNGKEHQLEEYHGKRTMLWLFSTWCHTCVAGVKALEKKQTLLEKQGFVILAIRNHNNGGYPGSSMLNFMKKFSQKSVDSDNWVLGEASVPMYQQLNPLKYPDIYFLIDEKGLIQAVSTAPNINMKSILNFAQGMAANK